METATTENLGEKIKAARFAKRMTQAQLAEKLGLTAAAVSLWETGINMPPLSTYFQLVKILNMKETAQEDQNHATINV